LFACWAAVWHAGAMFEAVVFAGGGNRCYFFPSRSLTLIRNPGCVARFVAVGRRPKSLRR
jgi:hypothetical protein